MTHAELRAQYPPARTVEASATACPGELAEVDEAIDPAAGGAIVRIFRCADCGRLIVLDTDDATIRNDYPCESFAMLVARLAAGFARR